MGSNFNYFADVFLRAISKAACNAIDAMTGVSDAVKNKASSFENIGTDSAGQSNSADADNNKQQYRVDDYYIAARDKKFPNKDIVLYKYKGRAKTVIVPDTVTIIGKYAFLGNCTMEHIVLPKGLQCIEFEAFAECTHLLDIEIPDSVYIIWDAFRGCTSLQRVRLPENYYFNALYCDTFKKCTALSDIAWPKCLKYVPLSAIRDCPLSEASKRNLQKLMEFSEAKYGYIRRKASEGECGSHIDNQKIAEQIIEKINDKRNQRYEASHKPVLSRSHLIASGLYCDNMTVIGIEPGRKNIIVDPDYCEADNNAFLQDIDLESIRFAGIIARVGSKACIGLDNLKSVVFEQSVHEIGHEAFSKCSALEYAEFRGEVGRIGKACFKNCPSLKTLIFAQDVDEIDNEAFASCSSLESLVFQGRVGRIGERCFLECIGLRKCIFQKYIECIDHDAFRKCHALKKVEFYGGLGKLGVASFIECTALTEIDIPDVCTEIGRLCFAFCIHLKYVHLPRELKKIESALFYNCIALQKIDWPEARIVDDKFYPMMEKQVFLAALNHYLWERFELEDGCMIRRQVNAAVEDPDCIFVIEPKGDVSHIQHLPRLIINNVLNYIWQITVLDKKSYHYLMILLMTALRLVQILAEVLSFDVRPFMLCVLSYRLDMLYDSSRIDDKTFEALLLYAIGFALCSSGGSGIKMKEIDIRILRLYFTLKSQDYEDAEDDNSDENDSEEEDSEEDDSEENDSEENDSEENDSEENDSEENDSEENDSEENDSEENDSEEDDSEEDDSEEDDSEENDSEEKNNRYDALIRSVFEYYDGKHEAEKISPEEYRYAAKAILRDLSIGPDVLYRYDPLSFQFVIPMCIDNEMEYVQMSECYRADAVHDYYSFSHAIQSLVKYHFGIAIPNLQDLSYEVPAVWFKVWGNEIREYLPQFSLVHISLKKARKRLENTGQFEKEFLNYMDDYKYIINTDYVMICIQAQIDELSKLFKEYGLEMIMTVYSNEFHLL